MNLTPETGTERLRKLIKSVNGSAGMITELNPPQPVTDALHDPRFQTADTASLRTVADQPDMPITLAARLRAAAAMLERGDADEIAANRGEFNNLADTLGQIEAARKSMVAVRISAGRPRSYSESWR